MYLYYIIIQKKKKKEEGRRADYEKKINPKWENMFGNLWVYIKRGMMDVCRTSRSRFIVEILLSSSFTQPAVVRSPI